MRNIYDRDGLLCLIYPVDDAVGAPPSDMPVRQRWTQALTHSLRVVEQRPHDELVRSEGHRLGKLLPQLSSGRGRNGKPIS